MLLAQRSFLRFGMSDIVKYMSFFCNRDMDAHTFQILALGQIIAHSGQRGLLWSDLSSLHHWRLLFVDACLDVPHVA